MESSASHGCSFVISLLHETHWHPMCLHLVSHTHFRLSSLRLRFIILPSSAKQSVGFPLPGFPSFRRTTGNKITSSKSSPVPRQSPLPSPDTGLSTHNRPAGELTQNRPGPYIVVIDCRHAPVAQLDRASDFESAGRAFESRRAYISKNSGLHAHVSRCFPSCRSSSGGRRGAENGVSRRTGTTSRPKH